MYPLRRSGDSPGDKQARADGPGNRLRSASDWESLIAESRTRPVLVFKHSTICGISAHVLEDFLRFAGNDGLVRIGVVHVVEDRALSDAIAEQTGIRHETPQVIAIRNERPIWHASHWSIDLEELDRRLTASN